MTPDELRALDDRAGEALARATRPLAPLVPWLAALWVIGGSVFLAAQLDGPWWQPYATGALAAVFVGVVLVDRRRQRVNAQQSGK